jgi:hypothetical protein
LSQERTPAISARDLQEDLPPDKFNSWLEESQMRNFGEKQNYRRLEIRVRYYLRKEANRIDFQRRERDDIEVENSGQTRRGAVAGIDSSPSCCACRRVVAVSCRSGMEKTLHHRTLEREEGLCRCRVLAKSRKIGELNRVSDSDSWPDWQGLSGRLHHHKRSISKRRRSEQNHRTSQRTSFPCTLGIS